MILSRQTSALLAGLMLMGLGGVFLIAQLLGGSFWSYFWPYPIIALGLSFFWGLANRGRGAGGLAIPGSIITTIGVLLLLQNSFGWWESWAFAWTFIVISVGVGIMLMGFWNQKERAQRVGLKIAGVGVGLLFIFGTFFGLGFSFLGFSFAARIIWPLMLIGVGAFLALRGIVVITQREVINKDRAPAITDTHPVQTTEGSTQSVAM